MDIYNKTPLVFLIVSGLIMSFFLPLVVMASERNTAKYFRKIQTDPNRLRLFLKNFPKGGDLHNHLSGAIYAENMLKWAAQDGKCVDMKSKIISFPPCDTTKGQSPVKDIILDGNRVNRLIDAFSTRNYNRRPISGHDQFFATFGRFFPATAGREGDMLAEVTKRAARQNMYYLELMQSWGMQTARTLGSKHPDDEGKTSLGERANDPELDKIARDTIQFTDEAERRQRQLLGCSGNGESSGCDVTLRYLAQVIRVFPRQNVLYQTLLAFKLASMDPRYVGINFVAPEDDPVTLRDYRWQMEMIRDVARLFPDVRAGISLHAGELAPGLVPPEDLTSHINEAVHIAGAGRIGHGVDIIYENDAEALLDYMARNSIMVEINLSSNADILGIEGKYHPFDLYRDHGVPLALSTDDEGVSRHDITHEYQRAVENYDISYKDLKQFSRNSLEYSFLGGDSLFIDHDYRNPVRLCRKSLASGEQTSKTCNEYLSRNDKARTQWQLEKRFRIFDSRH